MSRRIIILFVGLNLTLQLYGQVERQALQNIKKGNWNKARSQLTKAIRKDSANIPAAFAWANYYFAQSNPAYDLDTANFYALKSVHDFRRLPAKQQDRLSRIDLDSVVLLSLSHGIDSVAFLRAKGTQTTAGYQQFLTLFPGARERQDAIGLLHKTAFQDAIRINTYNTWVNYVKKYPESDKVPEAIHRYQSLLFDSLTNDRRLASYQMYLRDHPGTEYSIEAACQIFEIRTASGVVDSFITYIADNGRFINKARDILFHLIPEDQLQAKLPPQLWTDSLNAARHSAQSFVAPYLHNGKFGFMDPSGVEVTGAESEAISDDYICGNIADDVIILPNRIIAFNGAIVYDHPVNELDDLGYGFLLVTNGACNKVIHKSGFIVVDICVDDAKVINGKLLALQQLGKWSLYTLAGRMILSPALDEITGINDFVLLRSGSMYRVLSDEAVVRMAQGDLQASSMIEADDVSSWSQRRLWVRFGAKQRVLSSALETLWESEGDSLSPAPFGIIVSRKDSVYAVTQQGEASPVFRDIRLHGAFTIVKSDKGWQFFDPAKRLPEGPLYDTITFIGRVPVGFKKDSVAIHFSPSTILHLKQPVSTRLVHSTDTLSFLLVERGNKKSLYSQRGKRLFDVPFDQIQHVGNGFFTVSKRGKVGLVNSAGKLIVPAEMDAIGSMVNGCVSLLRDAKFGSFNCKLQKLIKPVYSTNLAQYNELIVSVFKDGFYRLVGWDNKPLTKLEFNEIRYWNDSVAFVRKDLQWMLYEIKSGSILLNQVKNYKVIREVGKEKLAIIQVDRQFGVFDNKKGIILPLTFSDIINVGSAEIPLYFAEKHVEEASIFVVTYYDAAGNRVRKEVYEQDEYERIYCPNN